MTALDAATRPADDAAAAVAAHHRALLTELDQRVAALAAAIDAGASWEQPLIELAGFLTSRVLWYTASEERLLRPITAHTPEHRPLLDSLRASHHTATELTETLINTQDPREAMTAADRLRPVLHRHIALVNRLLPTLNRLPEADVPALVDQLCE